MRDNSHLFAFDDDAERRETDYSKKPRCPMTFLCKPCQLHKGHEGMCLVILDDSKMVTILGDMQCSGRS